MKRHDLHLSLIVHNPVTPSHRLTSDARSDIDMPEIWTQTDEAETKKDP